MESITRVKGTFLYSSRTVRTPGATINAAERRRADNCLNTLACINSLGRPGDGTMGALCMEGVMGRGNICLAPLCTREIRLRPATFINSQDPFS
jgi:hypothetical protein